MGNASYDVCIVGAGFTGISAALHLAEQGFKVTVLEAVKVGFGASGRNGGQIVNSYSRDIDTIESDLAALSQQKAELKNRCPNKWFFGLF